jgi:cell division septation protein DedD
VQVGSFSKQATAERLAKQFRDQDQSAFVMPVKSGGATLYRVRIGPLQDRASAEAVLRDVKSSAPGAAIVAHP